MHVKVEDFEHKVDGSKYPRWIFRRLVHEVAQYNAAKGDAGKHDSGVAADSASDGARSAVDAVEPPQAQPPFVAVADVVAAEGASSSAAVPLPLRSKRERYIEIVNDYYWDLRENNGEGMQGGGSFGDVVKSEEFDLGDGYSPRAQAIAIKVPSRFLNDRGDEDSSKDRAREEAKLALAKEVDILKLIYSLTKDGDNAEPSPSSNIPTLFAVWPDMVVMKCYADSLSSRLENRLFGLPGDDAVSIVLNVCSALEWLHSEGGGIAHCDVKPENIMVDAFSSSTRRFAVLIDFGSAEKKEVCRAATQSTPAYLSPDMRYPGRSPPLDGHARSHIQLMRSDEYAVGLVAWELLYRLKPATAYRMFSKSWHWSDRVQAELVCTDDDLTPSADGGDCASLLWKCVQLCCVDRQANALAQMQSAIESVLYRA